MLMAIEIDPWGSGEVKDYGRIMKDFGIEPFQPFLKRLDDLPVSMKRGMVFGHRDFGNFLEARKAGKRFVMMTGLMPSGNFHLGHRMLADQIIWYQKMGAEIFLCVADIEAYNTRIADMAQLRKIAIEEYLLNYIALGLKPKNCHFYFQSARSADAVKSNAFYRLAGMVSRKVTHNELAAVYGELSPGKIMSVMVQVADILHPQLKEFGGPCPVVVPVGIDQDPHIRLSRDIASRFQEEFRFHPPCSTYHYFLKGLKGGKMSSSDPCSHIALSDNPKEAGKKIMKYAFSGGRDSIEEHRKLGGRTDVDVSYQYLHAMFEPDDRKIEKIRDDYTSGKMLSGELKQILVEKLQDFLIRHHEAREKAKDKIQDFFG
jgi:tryptophanyl-tRNA synthetase